MNTPRFVFFPWGRGGGYDGCGGYGSVGDFGFPKKIDHYDQSNRIVFYLV
jgi:hypothetical protein